MTMGVPLHLTESAKPRVRAASLQLSARVLRAAGMGDAADFLDQESPDAVLVSRLAPRVVSARVADADVIARAMRRGRRVYWAMKLRFRGVHLKAAEFLEHVASEVKPAAPRRRGRR
jgi:hypothetical protein